MLLQFASFRAALWVAVRWAGETKLQAWTLTPHLRFPPIASTINIQFRCDEAYIFVYRMENESETKIP